jgi:hypothetical protein
MVAVENGSNSNSARSHSKAHTQKHTHINDNKQWYFSGAIAKPHQLQQIF